MLANFNNAYLKSDKIDDLMVSIMLRYPEIGTIKYNPRHRSIKFTFLVLDEKIDQQQLSSFGDALKKALQTYNYIEKRCPTVIHADHSILGGVTLVNVVRDVETLYLNEIALVVDFFKEWFNPETRNEFPEEEMLFQEEIIRQSLEHLKQVRTGKWIIALREEGRVMVFNK